MTSYVEFRGKTYQIVALQDVSLAHTMSLQTELVEMNHPIRTLSAIGDAVQEVGRLSENESELKDYPHLPFVTLVVVWCAMVSAGEKVTLKGLMESSSLSELSSIKYTIDDQLAARRPTDRKASGKAPAGRTPAKSKTRTSARKSTSVSSS